MRVESYEELRALGAAASDLPTARNTKTPINVATPLAAARLIGSTEEYFEWEPVSTESWQSLSDEERGRITLDRAVGWLSRNAALIPAESAFGELSDDASNQLMGMDAETVHDVLCSVNRMMMVHELKVDSIMFLAHVIAASAGVHVAVLTGHAILTIVKAYGRVRCEKR